MTTKRAILIEELNNDFIIMSGIVVDQSIKWQTDNKTYCKDISQVTSAVNYLLSIELTTSANKSVQEQQLEISRRALECMEEMTKDFQEGEEWKKEDNDDKY